MYNIVAVRRRAYYAGFEHRGNLFFENDDVYDKDHEYKIARERWGQLFPSWCEGFEAQTKRLYPTMMPDVDEAKRKKSHAQAMMRLWRE